MMDTTASDGEDAARAAVLEAVAQRVLWLAVRMVDFANRERTPGAGIKVGGHQASSASLVHVISTLWLAHLQPGDRVAVKPHAAPALHAVQYLLGNLDQQYLTRFRSMGGLQAYPSRTKDPDRIDYSTGSVGLGPVATLFGALTQRYVAAHFGASGRPRQIALVGDAELDEGNIWEAVIEPMCQGLPEVTWIVDLNRQSLDRVVPGIRAIQMRRMFEANGWQVIDAKYGRKLQAAFRRPHGDALRRHIDEMPNEQYQSLFGLLDEQVRDEFLVGADQSVKRCTAEMGDRELVELVRNLGGHDVKELLHAYQEADNDRERPSVIFAYTIKGWGLPVAGVTDNHSALLSSGQIDDLRTSLGLTEQTEWDRFPPGSPQGELCQQAQARLDEAGRVHRPSGDIPTPVEAGVPERRPVSTQEAFGRVLVSLGRQSPLADRIVTASPDVSVSTNLGGWINRHKVFSHTALPLDSDDGDPARWRGSPVGRHIELGIGEMNLFLLLGQLGLAGEVAGERLIPIGTLYDPFVCRGLDALIYGTYSGARFIAVGTPSGVTLSPEGGAHQSTITASIGMELPGITFAEPAYAGALDWLLCDGIRRLQDADGESLYLRLTTRPLDQSPFAEARDRLGVDTLRQQVLAGCYRLVDTDVAGPAVNIFASGAVMPEALAATRTLQEEEVSVSLFDVTSLDRLYRSWHGTRQRGLRSAQAPSSSHHLASLMSPAERRAPIVTVHDAAPHAMAWIGSVFGAPVASLGVAAFGQSGTIDDLYRAHGLGTGAIVNAALGLLEPG